MARSAMGKDTVRGHPHVGPEEPDTMQESDLGSDLQGNNKLQGKDQSHVRNQRPDIPDELAERPKGPAQPTHIDRPKDRESGR